jgi:hypothetical protein
MRNTQSKSAVLRYSIGWMKRYIPTSIIKSAAPSEIK